MGVALFVRACQRRDELVCEPAQVHARSIGHQHESQTGEISQVVDLRGFEVVLAESRADTPAAGFGSRREQPGTDWGDWGLLLGTARQYGQVPARRRGIR